MASQIILSQGPTRIKGRLLLAGGVRSAAAWQPQRPLFLTAAWPDGSFWPPRIFADGNGQNASLIATTTTIRSFHSGLIQAPPSLTLPRRTGPAFQQVRWKRNDGNKASTRTRPPTRKQRRQWARRQRAAAAKIDKHGAPGSKAGPRRQMGHEDLQDFLQQDLTAPPLTMGEAESYGQGDLLLDDMMGNQARLGTPTPLPKYLGNLQQTLFNQVVDQMDAFRNSMDALERKGGGSLEGKDQQAAALVDTDGLQLPSDRDLNLAIRAFAHRFGSRRLPVGLAAALKHVLQDMGVPLAALGEHAFHALLQACRTPAEGRRVMQLMAQSGIAHTPYTYSILVDLHAQQADLAGCLQVHEEMKAAAGLAPVLASYTSLLAAAHKVVSDARLPYRQRHDAFETAWNEWQEMIAVNIEPDAMCCGAMLRLLAAKGRPERCISLLDDMHTSYNVPPTSLCFAAALQAVAKSHSIAVQLERGASPRHLRRERIAAHHAQLAQEIVILAQSYNVSQDATFVAALMQCAATAGDLATCKALYVASQLRATLDQFRTIGDNRHLARIRGEGYDDAFDQKVQVESGGANDAEELALLEESARQAGLLDAEGGGEAGLAEEPKERVNGHQKNRLGRRYYSNEQELHEQRIAAYREREYGAVDSRVLSALTRACAVAADAKQRLGTMWQGRENHGYLCINSIRLLKTAGIPQYQNNTLPRELDRRSDYWTEEKDRYEFDDKKVGRKHGRRQKGVIGVDDFATNVHELSPDYQHMVLDENDQKRPEYRRWTPEDVWKWKYGEHDAMLRQVKLSKRYIVDDPPPAPPEAALPPPSPQETVEALPPGEAPAAEAKGKPATPERVKQPPEGDYELVFSHETMKWEPRIKSPGSTPSDSASEPTATHFDKATTTTTASVNSDFSLESSPSSPHSSFPSDGGASWQPQEATKTTTQVLDLDVAQAAQLAAAASEQPVPDDDDETALEQQPLEQHDEKDFQLFFQGLAKEEEGNVDEQEARELFIMLQNTKKQMDEQREELDGEDNEEEEEEQEEEQQDVVPATIEDEAAEKQKQLDNEARIRQNTLRDNELAELRELLPMFSDKRLARILDAFKQELGDPSLIDLVLAVRERMPDYIDTAWLGKMSRLTSSFVMDEAERHQLVDTRFLNAMLKLKTSLGGVGDALAFRETEFALRKVEPNEYSDRLILQMFLKQGRFVRAMKYKQRMEAESRKVDLVCYASLVDFCAQRRQAGTALMLVRECRKVHGSIPNEANLKGLRHLCNQLRIDYDDAVIEVIGRDPNFYLKNAYRKLYHVVKTKKGRQMRNFVRT